MKRLTIALLGLALVLSACASGADAPVGGDPSATSVVATRPSTDVNGQDADGQNANNDVPGTPPGVPKADPVEPPAEKGPFFFDEAEVMVMESFPIQVTVRVLGSVPTPCDSPGWRTDIVGDEIHIEVYSIPLNDPAASCVAVIDEVELTVPLGSFEDGSYTVLVNGEAVGTFDA